MQKVQGSSARRFSVSFSLFAMQLALFVGVFAVLGSHFLHGTKAATPQNITVDYTQTVAMVNPLAFGMDETGYQSPTVLGNDSKEQQVFKALNLGYMRMDLIYATSGNPASGLICGGNGCDTGVSGDQWISAIKSTGAQPVVIVYTKSTVDAANAVKHFNVNPSTGKVDPSLPNYIKYWIVGNEPDLNGYSSSSYGAYFNSDYDAMKTIDSSIKVGGPTKAWYDHTWIQQFLQISGSRVDFLDFHGYPQSGTTNGNIPTLFQWATGTGHDIADLRALMQSMQPARAAQVPVEVGEWALDSGGSAQTHTNFNAVWATDVLGNILENGGISMFYGTKGNAVEWSPTNTVTDDFGRSITLALDTPQAPYHGIGMFTGESLFRGFGTSVVKSSTSLPNVDVFASDNAKNIVVVNKDQALSQTGVFTLNGIASGTIDVWQKNQSILFNAPPSHIAAISFQNGAFSYPLPAMSATTFVISSGVSSPAPTPAPSPTPSPQKPTPSPTPSAPQQGGTVTSTASSNNTHGTALTATATSNTALSGTIALSAPSTGEKTITYTVDGTKITSGSIDTTKLADGKHTIIATIATPNGATSTEHSTITVNNHNPFWKNVYLRYGAAKTVGGGAATVTLVALGFWLFILRPRTSRITPQIPISVSEPLVSPSAAEPAEHKQPPEGTQLS